MLKHSVPDLQQIALTANRRYRIGKQELKPDGTLRTCWDALGELKSIHARIQCMILHKVKYPIYLQGSIKDKNSPRGQKSNAQFHVSQRTVITEDVKQFFPSVRHQIVFDIWQKFFKFPPDVAEMLTLLTTKDGSLPQGTKTSALIANLVFWDDEWGLVGDFHQRGITYTRLVDDITCSSADDISNGLATSIIQSLHRMVHRKGLQLNARKQTFANAHERQVTTKLIVNRKTALPAEIRSAIRSEVQKLNGFNIAARSSESYQERFRKASGKVAYLKQHHPTEADRLRETLRAMRPEKAG